MRGVVVVAPRDAPWARRAEVALADARLHVARVADVGIAVFLVLAGGVRAVLVDQRSTGGAWSSHVARVAAASPRTRVIVIGEPSADLATGAVAWPSDAAAALALVGVGA